MKPFGHNASQLKVECPEIQASTLEAVVDFGLDWLAAKKIQTPFIIDDAGIFIEALQNFPGVYSRYVYDTIGLQGVLKQMEGLEDRSTSFKCVIGLMLEDGTKHKFVGECKGDIIYEKRGTGGFGYDPIFIPEGFDKTFGEMEPKLKMSVDHRFKAFLKIKKFFN